jgi:hypothetical protein
MKWLGLSLTKIKKSLSLCSAKQCRFQTVDKFRTNKEGLDYKNKNEKQCQWK